MLRRYLMICCVAAATLAIPSCASAVGPRTVGPANAPLSSMSGAAQREAIRQMPLLMRPNRPGHFYGNTVRRMHARRNGGF
jgi:hypothetical protein